jgi:Dolichyl-phosphate-mannose-protein mannosyltransferase
MTLNRGAQRAMIALFFSAVAVVYAVAWSLPAIGLDHEDAECLITAKAIAAGHGYLIESPPTPMPQTNYPPLFPAVLALFTLISGQTQWLKFLPLACAAGWLLLTRGLLLKMGASRNSALLLVGLTAASPTVVFLSTNLLPETLFALLATAALLALFEERALLAGILAALATLTRTAGVALIVACIFTLVARRRFRNAAIFATVAMVMVAPWFGRSLAHMTHNSSWVASEDIFTSLAANEKLIVLSRNLLSLLAGPFSLLTGLRSVLSIVGTILILLWCFYVRRQLVPDLFVVLYCLVLLCWISPPERFLAPILPLVLWIVWRVFRLMKAREALAALVLIAIALPLGADAIRIFPAHSNGAFAIEGAPADDWNHMRMLFDFIRANTAPDSVLLANMDGAFFLNTGRKTVRGFTPNGFDLFYAARQTAVTPDRLSNAILTFHVSYVVLTPDRGLAESASFHRSVEALERGGMMEPVSIPGAPRDYSLFKITPTERALTVVTAAQTTNVYYQAKLRAGILSVTQPVHGNHPSGRGYSRETTNPNATVHSSRKSPCRYSGVANLLLDLSRFFVAGPAARSKPDSQ